jgi:hypothetical protein
MEAKGMLFTQSYTIPIFPGLQFSATWLVFMKDSTLGMNVFTFLPVKAVWVLVLVSPLASTDEITGTAI